MKTKVSEWEHSACSQSALRDRHILLTVQPGPRTGAKHAREIRLESAGRLNDEHFHGEFAINSMWSPNVRTVGSEVTHPCIYWHSFNLRLFLVMRSPADQGKLYRRLQKSREIKICLNHAVLEASCLRRTSEPGSFELLHIKGESLTLLNSKPKHRGIVVYWPHSALPMFILQHRIVLRAKIGQWLCLVVDEGLDGVNSYVFEFGAVQQASLVHRLSKKARIVVLLSGGPLKTICRIRSRFLRNGDFKITSSVKPAIRGFITGEALKERLMKLHKQKILAFPKRTRS